jgi:hypothetical protein
MKFKIDKFGDISLSRGQSNKLIKIFKIEKLPKCGWEVCLFRNEHYRCYLVNEKDFRIRMHRASSYILDGKTAFEILNKEIKERK